MVPTALRRWPGNVRGIAEKCFPPRCEVWYSRGVDSGHEKWRRPRSPKLHGSLGPGAYPLDVETDSPQPPALKMRKCYTNTSDWVRMVFWVSLIASIAFSSRALPEPWSQVVIPVPQAKEASQLPNLLPNPDFEEGEGAAAEGWSEYEQGYRVAEGEGRNGSRGIVCENSSTAGRRGAFARVNLNQERPIPLYVEGWSKAENVSGGSGADYSIYVDCVYQDGTPLWGTNGPFSTGTHGWEKVSFFVTPTKPVKSLSVYLLFRSHSGKVWFDDVKLTQLSSAGGRSFDGVPTLESRELSPRVPAGPIGRTKDGLEIGLDQRCGISIVKVNGRPVDFGGEPCGFFVRDAAARSAFESLIGGTSMDEFGTAFLSATNLRLRIRLEATIRSKQNSIEISGTLSDHGGQDRAISLYFGFPVEGGKWVWWDDVTERRNTNGGGDFRNVTAVGAGENGTTSRYPLSAICDTDAGIGLSIAVPMDEPRLYRIAYDADRGILYIAYDFGLCQDVKASPGKATFKFIIYGFDPGWGFRAALQKYYDIYPQFFTKRLKKEGLWMAFHRISDVEKLEDFGFAFKEGDNETKFDDEHDILTFRYTEPQSYWQRMPKEADRSYQGCANFLEKSAASGNRGALATVSSGIFDVEGRYRLTVENAPWCEGCVFALNPSPSIKADVTKAKVNYDIGDAERRYGDTTRGELDGEYLDSLEGWNSLTNFRREHFASAEIPLTFDTLTKKPCVLNVFSIYEFSRYISEDVHKRGKLMMANAVPIRFGFFCHLFDTCGIEINWMRGRRFQPDDEAMMNYRRAMMFQKPYLFLMNTNFDSWGYEDTEKYMRRCMFYAFYPSFFSADASSNHYFSQPRLYNRDRPLFKKYVPIIRALGQAGWQPIPYARTSDPDVRIERFGDGKDCNLYFTLLNTASEEKEVAVEIDLAALGLAEKGLFANALSSTAQPQLSRRDGAAILTLKLSPSDSEAIRFQKE